MGLLQRQVDSSSRSGFLFSSFWKWVVLAPSSEKMGNATPYANKKWVACSDNKTDFNKLCARPP